MRSTALYLAMVLSLLLNSPAGAQGLVGGTSGMRNGLPATTVDSFVYEARENRDKIYGDEGTYMPPMENFTVENRINSGIYGRSDAGLTTGHGSYMPCGVGGDEFIGPEFSQSGSRGDDPNMVLANVPLVAIPDMPAPPPMTFQPNDLSNSLAPDGLTSSENPMANINLTGFAFGLGGLGPDSIKMPSGVPSTMVNERTWTDASGKQYKEQTFSDGSKIDFVQQSDGQLRPTKITYPDGSATVYSYDQSPNIFVTQGMPNGMTEINSQGQVVSSYTTTNYAQWTKTAGSGPSSVYGSLSVTTGGAAIYKNPISGTFLRGADGSVLPV